MLNQTEKRRQKLLEHTRNLYTDRKTVPAVHPRYKAAYYRVYSEDSDFPKSTFGLRMVISICLFAAFIAMKQEGVEICGMDSVQVLESIIYNFKIQETSFKR